MGDLRSVDPAACRQFAEWTMNTARAPGYGDPEGVRSKLEGISEQLACAAELVEQHVSLVKAFAERTTELEMAGVEGSRLRAELEAAGVEGARLRVELEAAGVEGARLRVERDTLRCQAAVAESEGRRLTVERDHWRAEQLTALEAVAEFAAGQARALEVCEARKAELATLQSAATAAVAAALVVATELRAEQRCALETGEVLRAKLAAVRADVAELEAEAIKCSTIAAEYGCLTTGAPHDAVRKLGHRLDQWTEERAALMAQLKVLQIELERIRDTPRELVQPAQCSRCGRLESLTCCSVAPRAQRSLEKRASAEWLMTRPLGWWDEHTVVRFVVMQLNERGAWVLFSQPRCGITLAAKTSEQAARQLVFARERWPEGVFDIREVRFWREAGEPEEDAEDWDPDAAVDPVLGVVLPATGELILRVPVGLVEIVGGAIQQQASWFRNDKGHSPESVAALQRDADGLDELATRLLGDL